MIVPLSFFQRISLSLLFLVVMGSTAICAQPRTGLLEIPTMTVLKDLFLLLSRCFHSKMTESGKEDVILEMHVLMHH